MTSAKIDQYIKRYPPALQALLRKMRATLRKAAPQAEEKMAYGIPTYVLNGNLVHFAAFRKHIGFYPGPTGIAAFSEDIEGKYKWAKGSVQFPFEEPLPLALVTRITKFRVKEALNRRAAQNKKKK